MPLQGDLKQFGLFRAMLDRMARVPSRVAVPAARALETRWRASYAAGTDPYGKPWAPLKPSTVRRKGHATILVETGETFDLTRVLALPGAGIKFTVGPKGFWHLTATENRAARPILPLYGLPATWRADIQAVAQQEFGKALKL